MTTLAASASSSAEPGTLAFLVVFGMAVILVFLFRSMSRHLRKVDAQAREQNAAKEPAQASDLPKDS
jgi:Na+-transporting methylmalonyl-CoA/oxaloacetate decarboxylase gamma subunit